MKCMINERKEIIPEGKKQGLGHNPSGEDEEFEWEMFGRERSVFLLREIG